MGLSGRNSHTVGSPTYRRMVLQGGVEVFVNDQATRQGIASKSRTSELVIHSDVLAEIRPTMAWKAGGYGLVVLGVVVCLLGLTMKSKGHKGPTVAQMVITSVAGTIVVGGGVLSVLGYAGPRRVIFDRMQGVVTILRGRVPLSELRAGLPLSRLAALQICFWIEHVTRKSGKYGPVRHYSYAMYELNAVLRGGNGERFVLMTDNDPFRLEHQAKQLSQMLQLPLIDCADRQVAQMLVGGINRPMI